LNINKINSLLKNLLILIYVDFIDFFKLNGNVIKKSYKKEHIK